MIYGMGCICVCIHTYVCTNIRMYVGGKTVKRSELLLMAYQHMYDLWYGVYLCEDMYVHMYVCTNICTYVRMYVCRGEDCEEE